MSIRFGSVCSGIEAASVAWKSIGWSAAWFSEIDAFPCAVLKHHYSNVQNLGDMTKLPGLILAKEVESPDVLCGGTPCQAFSVAGLRKSLDDARGNLSLTFCEIADAIDTVRAAKGKQQAIIFWENVPGVLSTKDNAFGCFLAGLAGEDDPLEPPGGKWTNAGYVLGPKRAVAWRILDAQYFGVAQRRRRVFVVASAREGFDPAAVLFEFEGVRRDTPPRREQREGTAGGAGACAEERSGVRYAHYSHDYAHDRLTDPSGVNPVLTKEAHASGNLNIITMAHGQGGDEIGFDRWPCLTCNHEAPIAAYAIQAGALRTNPNSGPDGVGVQEGHAYTLEARSEVQAVAFQPGNLSRGAGASPSGDVFPTLKAGHGRTFSDQSPPVAAVALQDVRGINKAQNGRGWNDEGTAYTVDTHATQGVATNMQVRRLLPEECELLQGFPKGYTRIPWRKKPASECPDGPRYKALGNSWAVPVVRWIGKRIANEIELSKTRKDWTPGRNARRGG